MGFFTVVGNILAGKPAYGAPAEQPVVGRTDSGGVPIVRLARVECSVQGVRMDVYADIHNESAVQVYLDKVFMLGTTHELDTALRAGEARQFHVYSGTVPHNASEHDVVVQYRTDAGNYFAARHEVRYHQESDGSLRVSEFRLIGPIKNL